MKVCIIGVQSEMLDEGMRNITTNIVKELSESHDVMVINPRKITYTTIKDLKEFNPDIIHYIHGPTIKSFILMKILSWFNRNAKTVMSATHPSISVKAKYILAKIKPDLMLFQSFRTQEFFNRLGLNTKYLIMSGVDINRFVPVSNYIKSQLRKKYYLKKDNFIILHIGSISTKRNLAALRNLQKIINSQVLVIGSSAAKANNNLIHLLKDSGCKVWRKYFPYIEELYQLSDLYIFPTKHKYAAIEIPLTVLEAMSCNLPVITFPFGGLPDVFKEKNGIYFAETDNEAVNLIKNIQKKHIKIETRKAVIKLSWEDIGRQLIQVYEKLIS